MSKRSRLKNLSANPDAPLTHECHKKPVSRREFIAQGFRAGTATLLGTSALSLFGERAHAISPDLLDKYYNPASCDLANVAGRKIPFVCFDLAGGANIAGSNVLVGGFAGQRDALSTAGYTKLGVPPDFLPQNQNPNNADSNDFVNDRLGLLFHSESAMLRGILERAGEDTQAGVNGAVIPCRSDNDTGNNPHNPTYGIYQAGARGQLLQLIGSSASVSGGNSMAPAMMIDPELRPTKIDRPSDASGLVDVGDLNQILSDPADVVAVMESMKRITDMRLDLSKTMMPGQEDQRLKERISCEYLKSADTLERFSNPAELDPSIDPNIVGANGIFTADEFASDREFRKTASVMKLVMDGRAAAGTITLGGYDYHTGDRRTGESRDLRAGRCIGAVLEYARRVNTPVMIYVFSDGSVASNGTIEVVDSISGRIDKGVWSGDNSSTGASFFLVYDPSGQPQLLDTGPNDTARHQQIGWMRPDASVDTAATPAANNVNLLVETVVLNYMALHGDEGLFDAFFPSQGLGSAERRLAYTAFNKLASVGATGTLNG
ncbi:Uncharacterised protein [BD1-7 clade bacterium]|uniref:General secretion pathway protein GspF n=1 Tax=BD1-7 clade bacterium TaxID=2029982 RepID=A0A5S9QSV5_9GAMM|nr:Uncharacterised protein [BD1-7 clade bacterium]